MHVNLSGPCKMYRMLFMITSWRNCLSLLSPLLQLPLLPQSSDIFHSLEAGLYPSVKEILLLFNSRDTLRILNSLSLLALFVGIDHYLPFETLSFIGLSDPFLHFVASPLHLGFSICCPWRVMGRWWCPLNLGWEAFEKEAGSFAIALQVALGQVTWEMQGLFSQLGPVPSADITHWHWWFHMCWRLQ